MKKLIFKSLPILFFVFCVHISVAQEMLKEASLKKQINNSSLIIEGKVISKKSYWDLESGLIYTSNTIEVYKSFKGNIVETIEVLTQGGTVGLNALNVSSSLKLYKGDIGIFMLNKSNRNSNIKFTPYGAIQGFYKYNLHDDLAVNPFNKKQGISKVFYDEIMSYTKTKYIDVISFDIESKTAKLNKNKSLLALGIDGFFPTTASAGIKSVLTINGTDFGTEQGQVGFSNSDEGGNGNYIDAISTQVLSWSDTQITVEIPSEAGTGKIRVTHDDGNIVTSTSDLTISHAELNVVFDVDDDTDSGGINGPIEPVAYPVQHIDANGNGGYTWEMQTDFFNDTEHPGARAAFERAFDNWRCTTEINWVISDTATAIDVIGVENSDGSIDADSFNVIRFDNGNELLAGVLGTCFSWYNGCSNNGVIKWYVTGMDIVFDDDTNWYFGTGSPGNAFDFESVALHELGHGHQLGHVIDENKVMHFGLNLSNFQRILSNEDIAGATNVQDRSTGTPVCNTSLMADSVICNLSIVENDFNNVVTLYPNPVKDELYIKNESFLILDNVLIYDVSGRLILNIDISEASSYSTEIINVSNFSKGVYIIKINSDEGTSILKKFIIR